MNPKDFENPTSGHPIRTRSGYWAFIPAPLPPELEWSSGLISLLSEADRALTQLAEVGKAFPKPHVMVKLQSRKAKKGDVTYTTFGVGVGDAKYTASIPE